MHLRKTYESCLRTACSSYLGCGDDTLEAKTVRCLRIVHEEDDASMPMAQWLGHQHVDKSIYVDQFERWFEHLPSSLFCIVQLESITSPEAQNALDALWNCLHGHSTAAPVASFPHRLANKHEITDDAYRQLRSSLKTFFEPYDRALQRLLRRSNATLIGFSTKDHD